MTVLGRKVQARTIRCRASVVVKRNWELAVLTGLLFLLLLGGRAPHGRVCELYRTVDWETVGTLAGIVLITTGIRRSRFFDKAALSILTRTGSELSLAVVLSMLSAAMATFLTNDIALLIVVPLTLSLQEYLENDIVKMVVFEAIAANVGSSLTPIGNPQNLFLWHRWGLPFLLFVREMIMPVATMTVLLALFVVFSFKNTKLDAKVRERCNLQVTLAAFSMAFLAIYVFLSEMRLGLYALPAMLLLYAILDPGSLKEANWPLIAVFILMFLDFHLLASVEFVIKLFGGLAQGTSGQVFAGSVLASQVISNVPAVILVSQFSHNWKAIAYGVNVGGNGLFVGSLANLIALKLTNDRKIWTEFHKYSIAYLLISAPLVYFLLL